MSRLIEVGLAMMDIRDENEALRADLKRMEAVVEAARWRVENCLKCEDGVIGEYVGCDGTGKPTLIPQSCPDCSDLRVPLVALDASLEGDG